MSGAGGQDSRAGECEEVPEAEGDNNAVAGGAGRSSWFSWQGGKPRRIPPGARGAGWQS